VLLDFLCRPGWYDEYSGNGSSGGKRKADFHNEIMEDIYRKVGVYRKVRPTFWSLMTRRPKK